MWRDNRAESAAFESWCDANFNWWCDDRQNGVLWHGPLTFGAANADEIGRSDLGWRPAAARLHRGYSAALANLTQPRRSDWEKGRPLLLIGHPHDETILALGEAQSHWHEGKIQVIPISAFISLPGGAEKKNALVKYR